MAVAMQLASRMSYEATWILIASIIYTVHNYLLLQNQFGRHLMLNPAK